MPGMDGLQLIGRLRQLGVPATTNYCILSGSIDEIDHCLLKQHGVFKQLLKPIQKEAFSNMMQKLVL